MTLSTESSMLTHKQLRHWVADRLRGAILEGQLRPGEWLRQERLAQEYGVSQMPVREALKELAAEGLVEHVPYRGVRVVAFTAADVEDLYAVRSFMEGKAVREAARCISEDELKELRQLHEQIGQVQSIESLPRYRELNRRFHQLMVAACRRTYLVRSLNQMWDAFPTMLWSNFAQTAGSTLPQRDAHDQAEHEAILCALEQHDAASAERLVREHIENAGRDLFSVLQQQGL